MCTCGLWVGGSLSAGETASELTLPRASDRHIEGELPRVIPAQQQWSSHGNVMIFLLLHSYNLRKYLSLCL